MRTRCAGRVYSTDAEQGSKTSRVKAGCTQHRKCGISLVFGKVDGIASRGAGLSLHGFLRLFPCDQTLNPLEFVLDLDIVRNLDNVGGCARHLERFKVIFIEDFDHIAVPVLFSFSLDSFPFALPILCLDRGTRRVVRRRWDWGFWDNPMRFQHICNPELNTEPAHPSKRTTYFVSDTGSGRSAKWCGRYTPL